MMMNDDVAKNTEVEASVEINVRSTIADENQMRFGVVSKYDDDEG
jgi:hypothetical protein